MLNVNVIDSIQLMNNCCTTTLWRTNSFSILRKQLSQNKEEIGLDVGICETCENFILIEQSKYERL